MPASTGPIIRVGHQSVKRRTKARLGVGGWGFLVVRKGSPTALNRGVAQLAERLVHSQEVAGSGPATATPRCNGRDTIILGMDNLSHAPVSVMPMPTAAWFGGMSVCPGRNNHRSVCGNPANKPSLFDERRVAWLRGMGMSIKAVSAHVGMSVTSVRSACHRLGLRIDVPRRGGGDVDAAVKLYVSGLSIVDISKRLGRGTSTVFRWVEESGYLQPFSARKAMFSACAPVGNYGRRGVVETAKAAHGFIRVDSTFEAARVLQLDADSRVRSMSRAESPIPYVLDGVTHHYAADFSVTLLDGTVRIEEVKPARFVSTDKNQAKFAAARSLFGDAFVVVSEDAIGSGWLSKGLEAINRADALDIQAWRRERRLAQRRAAQKTYLSRKAVSA